MNKSDETDLSGRLRIERQSLGLSQFDVADLLGVNQKTVARWEKETAIPSDKLQSLHAHGFDVVYVLTGQRMPRPAEGLSERESAVLDNFRSLPEEDRAAVQRLTNALAQSAVNQKQTG